MTTLVDWNIHQAGLPDLRQLVPRRVPHEGDVPLSAKHVDELLQQPLLLIAPCLTV
jgi:hypothetical protein